MFVTKKHDYLNGCDFWLKKINNLDEIEMKNFFLDRPCLFRITMTVNEQSYATNWVIL